jgi:hypothetical protein
LFLVQAVVVVVVVAVLCEGFDSFHHLNELLHARTHAYVRPLSFRLSGNDMQPGEQEKGETAVVVVVTEATIASNIMAVAFSHS